MKHKTLKILLSVFLVAVLIVLAQGTSGVWSDKAEGILAKSGIFSNTRALEIPNGTVEGEPKVKVEPAECSLLATYCITTPGTGVSAMAITELPAGITPPEGSTVEITRMIQVVGEGTTSGVKFYLVPKLLPEEYVAYWDGTQWITLEPVNGVFYLPDGLTLPVTIVVFTK